MRIHLIITVAAIAMPAAALVQSDVAPVRDQTARANDNTAFGLGEIIVTGVRPQGIAIGGDTLGQEAIYAFDRTSLDQAANLIPGVSSGNSGGSRNERLIFVRGFNRFEVPLTIDGIRVYLPADNRLDYGRFLTPDIAEIQVAKGYVSVLNGPDGMGGAINLVTRKPTKDLEIEARSTLDLGREGEYAGYNVFGLVGTRQDKWYAQASYARNFQDHWDLAGGFVPTAIENGGHRDLSQTEDWRVNAKIGFTPHATDEYSLSYTRQEGAKLAPLHITDPIAAQRYWTWPTWNLDSLYFLSSTALGDVATLKTRLYRNTFYNLLRSFSTAAENTQVTPKAFNSPYNDNAYGGSIELAVDLTSADHFTFGAQYRRDEHNEAQQSFSATTLPNGTTEPNQRDLEETYSLAAENRLTLAPGLILTAVRAMTGAICSRRRTMARRSAPIRTRRPTSSIPIHCATAVRGARRASLPGRSTRQRTSTPASRRARVFRQFSSGSARSSARRFPILISGPSARRTTRSAAAAPLARSTPKAPSSTAGSMMRSSRFRRSPTVAPAVSRHRPLGPVRRSAWSRAATSAPGNIMARSCR